MNAINDCRIVNDVDENGNPTGGEVDGIGLSINWQNGPLGRGEDRKEPNGAFVETVISAARQRLAFYQDSKFNSDFNARAIAFLDQALAALEERTASRESAGTEGTYTI